MEIDQRSTKTFFAGTLRVESSEAQAHPHLDVYGVPCTCLCRAFHTHHLPYLDNAGRPAVLIPILHVRELRSRVIKPPKVPPASEDECHYLKSVYQV